MSMFKIDELAGSLIKQGRFKDALPKIGDELKFAIRNRVITEEEYFGENGILVRFGQVLLNPNNSEEVEKLGNDLIFIAIRIPHYVKRASEVN